MARSSTVVTKARLDKEAARRLARELPLGEARALVGLVFKQWPHNGASFDEWRALDKKGLVIGNFEVSPKGLIVAEEVHNFVAHNFVKEDED
jgi:hypothetical protein